MFLKYLQIKCGKVHSYFPNAFAAVLSPVGFVTMKVLWHNRSLLLRFHIIKSAVRLIYVLVLHSISFCKSEDLSAATEQRHREVDSC